MTEARMATESTATTACTLLEELVERTRLSWPQVATTKWFREKGGGHVKNSRKA